MTKLAARLVAIAADNYVEAYLDALRDSATALENLAKEVEEIA